MPLRFARVLLALSLAVVLCAATGEHIEPHHSVLPPFAGARVPYWEYGGSAVLTDDVIRLTPAVNDRRGWLWNEEPVEWDEWELRVRFLVHSDKRQGADGLAVWLLPYRQGAAEREGPVYGGPDSWTGLGVFVDTFDNDGRSPAAFVSAHWNDGTKPFDHGTDGKTNSMASCHQQGMRNSVAPVELILTLDGGRLSGRFVFTGANGAGEQRSCFTDLPMPAWPAHLGRPHLAITAATGGLSDNHDLISVEFRRLNHDEVDARLQQEQREREERERPAAVPPTPLGANLDFNSVPDAELSPWQRSQKRLAELRARQAGDAVPNHGAAVSQDADVASKYAGYQQQRSAPPADAGAVVDGDGPSAAPAADVPATEQQQQQYQQQQQQQQQQYQQQQYQQQQNLAAQQQAASQQQQYNAPNYYPPSQQQQQQQQPPASYYQAPAVDLSSVHRELASLDSLLRLVRDSQTALASRLDGMASLIASVPQQPSGGAAPAASLPSEYRALVDLVTHKLDSLHGYVSKEITLLAQAQNIAADRLNTITSVGRTIEENSRLVEVARRASERTETALLEQNNIMRSNFEKFAKRTEASMSRTFWTYAIIVQVVLAVSFMWWKRQRDETSRKYF